MGHTLGSIARPTARAGAGAAGAGAAAPRAVAADADADVRDWSEDLAFRSVVEATADTAGLEFLRQLVKHIAEAMGVRYAFVAEFAGSADRVRTVAFWGGETWVPNVEYALAGTPCEQVVRDGFCFCADDVQRCFPSDLDLATIDARSYIGMPLIGAHGEALGHLAAIDTRPMPGDPRGMSIFRVFANRARVELERLRSEVVLQRACADLEVRLESTRHDLAATRHDLNIASGELAALLEINQVAARHLRREALFGALAGCLRNLLPTDRFGIELPVTPDWLRVHVLAMDRQEPTSIVAEFTSAGTACRWAQENRKWFVSSTLEELRERFPTTHTVMAKEGMESLCALPLMIDDRSFGALFFMSRTPGAYREFPLPLLERVASAVAVALDNCFAYEELGRLRDRLAVENVYLREEIKQEHNFGEIVGRSTALRHVMSHVEAAAPTDSTVLILGETGTGKEMIARAIHERSGRRSRPMVKVNCAAISAGLVESELFGHVRGAFTGAVTARTGRFEVADGGTIFLDEVGELPPETQVKLLRVLQEHEFEPVGSSKPQRVDVRVIAATNRNLEEGVAEGRFRSDLYYRLNVLPIVVPPLRARLDDLPLLVHVFVDKFARALGKRIDGIAPATMDRLRAYDWPGNVRELQNLVERAVVLAQWPVLDFGAELKPAVRATSGAASGNGPTGPERTSGGSEGDRTLAAVERDHIVEVLEQTRWIIDGPRGAASLLGMAPSTLRSRMAKLGVRRPAQPR